MGVLGSPEIAALVCCSNRTVVHGVRMRKYARGFEVVKYASAEHAEWQLAANRVLKDLAVNSSVYSVLAVKLDQCEVFECALPSASVEVMREALRFEVPRQLLSVPADFRLQYALLSNDEENGISRVRCAVFPESSLHKLASELTSVNGKFDAVINPVLALPGVLPPDAVSLLEEVEDKLVWQNGFWQQIDESSCACNRELDSFLKKHCQLPDDSADWLKTYRSALCSALFAAQTLFVDNKALAAVSIMPDYLRPARYRNALRLMALLAVLLVTVNVFRYAGGFIGEYREYRKLYASVKNMRSKVQDLRKKVKNGKKELKENQRTAELKLGSRECLGYLGYLSEKLPEDVHLANFRWNEEIMDLNLQTTSPELDLVSFFNRLPGVKVISASQRTNQANNFTNANVKLSVQEEKKPAKSFKTKKKAKK